MEKQADLKILLRKHLKNPSKKTIDNRTWCVTNSNHERAKKYVSMPHCDSNHKILIRI